MRLIKIGRKEAQICATCEFWEMSPDLVTSRGYANSPETMILDDQAVSAYAFCIKRRMKQNGIRSCSNYQLHYSLKRYL